MPTYRSVAKADVAELTAALDSAVTPEKEHHLIVVTTNKVLSTTQFKQMFYSRGDDFFQIANVYECPDSCNSIHSSVWGIDCQDPHSPGEPGAPGLSQMDGRRLSGQNQDGQSVGVGYSSGGTNAAGANDLQKCFNFNKLGGRENDPKGCAWAYSYAHDGDRNFYAQHEVMGYLEKDTCVKRDFWTACSRMSIEDQLYGLAFASETDQDLCMAVTCARRWSEVEDALAESCAAANTTIQPGAGSPETISPATTSGDALTRSLQESTAGSNLKQQTLNGVNGATADWGYIYDGALGGAVGNYAKTWGGQLDGIPGSYVGSQKIHFGGTGAGWGAYATNDGPAPATNLVSFNLPNYGNSASAVGSIYVVHVEFAPVLTQPTGQTQTEPRFRVAIPGATWPVPTGVTLPTFGGIGGGGTAGLESAAAFGPTNFPTKQQTNPFTVTSANSKLVITIAPDVVSHKGEFIITLKRRPPPRVDLYINVRVSNGHPNALDTILRVRFTVAYTNHEPSALNTWNTRASTAAAGVIQSGVVGDAPEGGKEQHEDTTVVN